MNIDGIRTEAEKRLSEKRLIHVMGCEKTAVILAQKYGVDTKKARLAALLHDITKEYPYEKQLKICADWGIILDNTQREENALLHAITGAYTAKYEFDVPDDVFDAILYHTTGRENMSALEKTICLADYIEPSRHFESVDELRKMSEISPDDALIRAFGDTICYTVKAGGLLHPTTVLARNDLLRRKQDSKL